MKKQNLKSKLSIGKQSISNLRSGAVKGGAAEWTKPLRMCILSHKDIDCSPPPKIDLTLPKN